MAGGTWREWTAFKLQGVRIQYWHRSRLLRHQRTPAYPSRGPILILAGGYGISVSINEVNPSALGSDLCRGMHWGRADCHLFLVVLAEWLERFQMSGLETSLRSSMRSGLCSTPTDVDIRLYVLSHDQK